MTDDSINDYRPPCPVVYFVRKDGRGKQQIYTVHCERLKVSVECYVSTAIVNIQGTWTNRTNNELSCVFAIPTPGTIMNVTLRIGKDRIVNTAVISNDEARELMQSVNKQQDIVPEEQNPYEQFIPDLFRLPFEGVSPGDTIEVKCEYLQQLPYYTKGYVLSLPLTFETGTVIENATWDRVVECKVRINAISDANEFQLQCWTNEISQSTAPDGAIVLDVGRCKAPKSADQILSSLPFEQSGRDFECAYKLYDKAEDQRIKKIQKENQNRSLSDQLPLPGMKVLTHCICQTSGSSGSSSGNGSLALFMTPAHKPSKTFGRAFYFLLDRSGSMGGEPYAEAAKALELAIGKLRSSDRFGICAFDHNQIYFRSQTELFTKEQAMQRTSGQRNVLDWMNDLQPERGGTSMMEPIQQALNILEKSELLPFLVLITDGAVHNEREICERIDQRRTKKQGLRTRVLTLGIGSYCNWFFLKMLAQIGRGFSDVVVYKEHIKHKTDHLIKSASTPVMTDIEFGFQAKSMEVYPFPVPDLFVGAPIVVASRFEANEIPSKVVVRGYDPDGELHTIDANVVIRNDLPVDKIFVKQQIDLLTAQAWFKQNKKLEKEIIDISVEHSLPSQYTSLVSYEARADDFEREQKKWGENDLDDSSNNNNSGSNKNIDNNNDKKSGNVSSKNKKISALKNNKKTVAGLAVVGTLAIVAVSIASFGDVAATDAGVPVFGGLGDIDGGADGCCEDGCCDDDACGDCDDCDLGGCECSIM